MLNSDYRPLGQVELPYAGRQMYMHRFDLKAPVMAEGYEDYLEPVAALCEAAGARQGLAFLTVDEKIVAAGASQRRPGPHVDGCFTGPKWDHPEEPTPNGPGWLHHCNLIPGRGVQRMSVIVAASVPGCRAWRGVFDGEPNSVGDLSHIQDQLGAGEVLPANVGYLLSPDCVHESMIFDRETPRTFLRIALPLEFNA
jgi:hypothetical protein